MGSATNVALPAIGREFVLDAVSLSWIATAYLLSAAVFLVPFGKLADIHGRERVFVGGLVVYTVTSLLCALSPTAGMLLAGRILQGLGGGMVFGTAVALLSSVYPPGQRGGALGVTTAAVYLGLSLGPFLGGVLTGQLGWRSVFHANVLLGTATTLIAARGLRGASPSREDGPRAGRFDLAGSGLYGLGLAALMNGLGRLPGLAGAVLTAAGLGVLAVFVAWERRTADPVLDLGLFATNRVFAFSSLAALVNYASTFAVGFLLSLYLQEVRGWSAQAAGGLLALQPLVQAALSPAAGRLSDRMDPRFLASGGMAVIALALAGLAFLVRETSLSFLAGALVLLGGGFGLFSSPNTNAVMGSVEAHAYGVASATLAATRLVGQMLSMGLAGLILGLLAGRAPVGPDQHEALLAAVRTAFAVFSALCLAGTFASLARGRCACGVR
jgi:EmrB/QacA subfamily drug resistance transporter